MRKLLEHEWADRHYAGRTPNPFEYDQGFFVKGATGSPDVKLIAGLQEPGPPRSRGCSGRLRGSRTAPRRPRPSASRRARRSSTSDIPTSAWTCWSRAMTRVSAADLAPRVELTPDEVEAAYGEIEQAGRDRVPARTGGPARRLARCAGWAESFGFEPSSPVDEQALLRIARAIRHRGAGRVRAAARPRRRSGLDPAGDHRPPRRLAALRGRS